MLSASDELDFDVLAISLSDDKRIPLRMEQLKPVQDAQKKPLLIWIYTLLSAFARAGFAECGFVLPNLSQLASALHKVTLRSLRLNAGKRLRLNR